MANMFEDELGSPGNQGAQAAPQGQSQQPQQAPTNSFESELNSEPKQSTFMDNINILNRNFAKVGNGGLQLGALLLDKIGVDTSQYQAVLAKMDRDSEELYNKALQNSPRSGAVTNIASQIGAAVATPGAQFGFGTAAKVGARVAQSFGSGMLMGAEHYTEGDTLKDKFQDAVVGGMLGIAAQGAGGAVQIAKDSPASLFKGDQAKVAEEALARGEPLTLGAATGNESLQAAETALSSVPLSGGRKKVAQVTEKLRDSTISDLKSMGVAEKDIGVLAEDLQSAVKGRYLENRSNVNKMYDDVAKAADAEGLSIPLSNTQQVAEGALKDLGKISGGLAPSRGSILDTAEGKLLQDLSRPELKASYGELKATRDDIQGLIKGMQSKGENPGGMVQKLSDLKKAFDSDLQAGAKGTSAEGGLKAADASYKELVAPFKDKGDLESFVRGKLDADQLLKKVVKGDRPILTQKVMDVLPEEGKKAYTRAIIGKIANDAGYVADDVGSGLFDLTKFSNGIRKFGASIKAIPDTERKAIKGMADTLERSKHIIQADKDAKRSWVDQSVNLLKAGTMAAVVGVPLGAVAGPVVGVLAAGAAMKLVASGLTNPKLVSKLVDIANKTKGAEKDTLIRSTLKSLTRGAFMGELNHQRRENVKGVQE